MNVIATRETSVQYHKIGRGTPLKNRGEYPKMRDRLPQSSSEKDSLVSNTKNICENTDVKQLNGFQDIEEHKKSSDTKN